MADTNRIGSLAEDLRFLGYAQHMAMTAQTDDGKRLLESFAEQEKQRIEVGQLPVSELGQGGAAESKRCQAGAWRAHVWQL